MSGALSFDQLFDPDFLAALDRFSLRIPEAARGRRLAEQRTHARGQGSDFADFKPYVPGDDLRTIDWNIYRRLGRVFVRTFEEQHDLPVYLMVDCSKSMFLERPPRIVAALRTALALAAVALRQHDSVGLFPFSDRVTVQLRGISGKNNVIRVARHLADYEPQGGTALTDAIDRLAAMQMRRGLVVILSDFFDPAGIDSVIASLKRLPHRLLLVQMTKPHDAEPERHPDLHGDLEIVDGEGGGPVTLTMTPDLLARYRELYADFTRQLTGFAAAQGAGIARIDASAPVLPQLTGLFQAGAMAR